MIRLAVLDANLTEQLRANPKDASDLELAWAGTDLYRLLQEGPLLGLDVVVANVELFSGGLATGLRELREAFPTEQIVVLYTFVRRAELERLAQDGVRVVRGPLSLRALKAQVLGVLVKKIFSEPSPSSTTRANAGASSFKASTEAPKPRPNAVELPPSASRRFSEAQLARMQELQSGIQCECPNHVAQLVLSLRSFEDYSASCANRDDKDAQVHRKLYEQTARARLVMEEALAMLVEHENIRL